MLIELIPLNTPEQTRAFPLAKKSPLWSAKNEWTTKGVHNLFT